MRLIAKRGRERIAFPIDEGETYIGRKDYCEVFFPDPSLSKRHARLLRRGGRLLLFDAGSRNGTFLNGEPVDEDAGVELRSGDVILCGKVRFTVEGVGGGSRAEDFEVLPEEPPGRRSRSARTAGQGLLAARAVASADARPSMLDVLPELPPSVEGQAYAGEAAETSEAEPSSAEPRARLRLVDGGPEQVWELQGDVLTLGSKPGNHIVLAGEGVSRYHAELVREEGEWYLKDLGARNGVFIAGERIDVHKLSPGDEVQIGTLRLRFEVETPGLAQAYAAAFARLREDPVGALKSDPKIRMAAAALVTALLLLVLVLPSRGGPHFRDPGEISVGGNWLQTGSKLLISGDYKQARDLFRKAKVQVPQHQERVPNTLERIADLWGAIAGDPERFRWKRAAELLAVTPRLKGLPDELRAWLAAQTEFVDGNLRARDLLERARTLSEEAKEHARHNDVAAALRSASGALQAFQSIDRESRFAEIADRELAQLRRGILDASIREVERRMRASNPNWVGTLDFLERVRPFAETLEEKQALRRLAERCETNRRDEVLYVRAARLIDQRIVAKYSDARRMFEQIDRRSRVYPDAQAYIDWIEADLKVRKAQRAYDIGDAAEAFRLLEAARQYASLGPKAKESIEDRQVAWQRVVREYKGGMLAFRKGDHKLARRRFQRVLRLEPNRKNRFYVRSRDLLRHIDAAQKTALDQKLQSGLEALGRGDHAEALKWFREVREDPNHRERDLERIRRSVARREKEQHLLEHSKARLLRDERESFLELRDTFKLLTLWLPRKDPRRREARKHLDTVVSRIKNWAAGSGRRPR
ncbi:MAG: FHA domain-containing protein [Planctomycetota bacterium]|nr:MAG: FHA domain-containing protein [Planctomycetota bacterium]